MTLKNLYFKSLMVTLIVILLGTAIVSPRLGLAQESELGEDQEPGQVDVASTEEPSSLEGHPLSVLFEDDGDPFPPQDDLGNFMPSQAINFGPNRGDVPNSTVILEGGNAERDMLSGTRAPGVLVIPVADFRSDGTSPSGFTFSFSGGYITGSSSDPCLMAPVYLPQGVAINQVWATVLDNATNQYVWVGLFRMDNNTGAVTEITNLFTTNSFSSSSLQSIGSTGLNTLVEFPTYSYYLGTCLTGISTRLYSIRIYYDL